MPQAELTPTPLTTIEVDETAARAIPITPTPLPTPTLISPPLSVGDSFIPGLGNGGYDVTHYHLTLALDPGQWQIEGTAVITFQVTVDDLATLALDFVGFQIDQLLLDDVIVQSGRLPKKLTITPNQPLQFGTLHTLTVTYSGAPTQDPACCNHLLKYMGLQYPGDDTVFAANQPDGARYWFPANDHLEDKALFSFDLIVPNGYTAVANGKLLSETAGSSHTTFSWQHAHPMAPYLATVAVGRFVVVEQPAGEFTMRHYVLPELLPQFEEASANLPEALSFMAGHFGAYPFDSFGFVTVRLRSVSLETQTMALLSANTIDEQWLVHELSHMWFGNHVGLSSWGEMWRNEGFATWAEAFWLGRNDPALFDEQFINWQTNVDGRERGYSLANYPPSELLGFEQYYKGAQMVHALRQAMGDDAFFTGLRTYFTQYGRQTASDAAFQAVMEEAAEQSLQPVWDQWFTR